MLCMYVCMARVTYFLLVFDKSNTQDELEESTEE